MKATILFAPLARARRALVGAIARLLAWWPRRRETQEGSTDETRRARSTRPTCQLRARSAGSPTTISATPSGQNVLPRPNSPATEEPATRRHRIGRIGPPNLFDVSVECECGWAVKADRLADALSAFDRHAATKRPREGN